MGLRMEQTRRRRRSPRADPPHPMPRCSRPRCTPARATAPRARAAAAAEGRRRLARGAARSHSQAVRNAAGGPTSSEHRVALTSRFCPKDVCHATTIPHGRADGQQQQREAHAGPPARVEILPEQSAARRRGDDRPADASEQGERTPERPPCSRRRRRSMSRTRRDRSVVGSAGSGARRGSLIGAPRRTRRDSAARTAELLHDALLELAESPARDFQLASGAPGPGPARPAPAVRLRPPPPGRGERARSASLSSNPPAVPANRRPASARTMTKPGLDGEHGRLAARPQARPARFRGGDPRRSRPVALNTIVVRRANHATAGASRMGHLRQRADHEQLVLGNLIAPALDDGRRPRRPFPPAATRRPGMPVKLSVTKNGWVRKFRSRRHARPRSRSSADSSSMPSMEMMSRSSS